MKRLSEIINEYPHDIDEGYESLVDLFTLLSIALIVASIVFGMYKTKSTQYENKITELDIYNVGSKSSYQVDIPRDEVIVLVSGRGGAPGINILVSGGLVVDEFVPRDKSSLFSFLDKHLLVYLKTHKFTLVLDKNGRSPPYVEFTRALEWLNNNGINKVSTAFWG